MRLIHFTAVVVLGTALACPDHQELWKRDGEPAFDYQFPEDWGHLNEEYLLCATGTHQAPLGLARSDGASIHHTPSFNYPKRVNGSLENSGRTLVYTLSESDNSTSLPSFSFEEGDSSKEEVYLIGWHLHSPSEHRVDGEPAKAEMHLVHTDAEGNPRSVLGFLIQPSLDNDTQSSFFDQIPQPFPDLDSEEQLTLSLDPTLAIEDVGGYKNFWSYEGSLTTPPCTEGLRWFVSQQPLYVDSETLRNLLAVIRYTARPSQQRWMHALNE